MDGEISSDAEVDNKELELEYSNLIIPASTLHNSFWTYFGFPADEDKLILTRSNIICTLCFKSFPYDGSNSHALETHIKLTHPEKNLQRISRKKSLSELSSASSSGSSMSLLTPIKKYQKKSENTKFKNNKSPLKRNSWNKFKRTDSEDRNDSNVNDDNDNEGEAYFAEQYDEFRKKSKFSKLHSNNIKREYLSDDIDDADNFDEDQISENMELKQEKGNYSDDMESAQRITETANDVFFKHRIVQFLIRDLLHINIVEGAGFKNFIKFLMPNKDVQFPKADNLSNTILKLHRRKYRRKSRVIMSNLKDSPYSLTFEKWTNSEQKTFLTVTIFYVESYKLKNFLLATKEYSTVQMNFEFCFELVDQGNCTAAVLNYIPSDDDLLKEFLDFHDIPYISTIDCILQSCVNRCFEMPTINEVYESVVDFMRENYTKTRNNLDDSDCDDYDDNEMDNVMRKSVKKLCKIDENFWLTKYNILEEFYNFCSDSMDQAICEILTSVKCIIESLQPLKTALATMVMETYPLASLLRPLASQLLDYHFTINETDNEIELAIKEIIHNEIGENFLNSQFLSISSFIDPRFQHLTSPDDIDRFIKTDLQYKCVEDSDPENMFDYFTEEFRHYRKYITANLEECPIKWWSQENSLKYRFLKKAANIYNCVPTFTQINYKLSLDQQILYFKNRASLPTELIDSMIWLHYNRNNNNNDV